MKKSWTIQENYHTQEFHIKEDYLLHKDWFDPGKDPNRNKISFDEILSGKKDYHFLISLDLKPWIFKEIKENIRQSVSEKS